MDAQEIFDTVARHLFKQGEQAIENGNCRYRTNKGLRCAVGVFISDQAYRREMDYENVSGTGVTYLLRAFSDVIPDWFRDYESLLSNLQNVHDNPEAWETNDDMKGQLRDVAKSFDLDASVLDELRFFED